MEHQGLLAAGRDSDDMLPALSRLTGSRHGMASKLQRRGKFSLTFWGQRVRSSCLFVLGSVYTGKKHTQLSFDVCVCACVHTPPPPAVYSACGLNFESHAADYGHVHKCRNFKCRKYQET